MTNVAIKIQEAMIAIIFCLVCYAAYTNAEQTTIVHLLLLLMYTSTHLEGLFLRRDLQSQQEQIDKLNYRLFKETQRRN